MNGPEFLLGVIAGFVTGILLRAGREEEAYLRGIAIGRRQAWHSLSRPTDQSPIATKPRRRT